MVLLIYGSLLPLQFDYGHAEGLWRGNLTPLSLHRPTLEDLVVNVLVYVPLGFFGGLALRRHEARCGRVPVLLCVVSLAVLLSLTLECLQAFVPARVPSWVDVFLNAMGGAVGATIALVVREFSRRDDGRLPEHLKRRPMASTAVVLSVGLLLWNLAPFDFVLRTSGIAESFLHAHWSVIPQLPVTSMSRLVSLLVPELDGAVWFAVLAYIVVLACRETGRTPQSAVLWSIQHGLILAVLIEFLQLFTRSHVFEVSAIVVRVPASVIGAAAAAYVVCGQNRLSQRYNVHRAPTGLLMLLLLYQPYRLVVFALSPVEGAVVANRVVNFIPFYALWREPAVSAALEIAGVILSFGTFALVLGMVLVRIHARYPWAKTVAVVTMAALVLESLQTIVPGRTPDPSVAILALSTTIAIGAVGRRAMPAAAASPMI